MFLIARIDESTGWASDWFVGFTLRGDKVEVSTDRGKARRFKSEDDAYKIYARVKTVAVKDRWRVIEA
ncbi:MAG: hypothetical protein AAF936_08765 [Pseudomonadota bacterium]